MKKLVIVGTGYVGLVAGVSFAEIGHQVACVDVDESKIALLQTGKSPIFEAGIEELLQKNLVSGRLRFTTDYQSAYREADAIFIGVGTPEQPDGSADLSYLAAVARQIAETIETDCLVVIKSTVPVGTNQKVELCIRDFLIHDVKVEVASNPEFLAQGSALQDTFFAARIIIGADSKWAEDRLKEIYQPFNLPIVSVSRNSAEMIKYASNNFLALKISYMNDIANLCERLGADIQEVAAGMGYDQRIGSGFLNAGVGYGGSCFPKDTKALQYLAQQYGYDLRTVKAAIDVNHDQKTILFRKACIRLMTLCDLRVAVLGLTFKPGTDDLREAPSLDNIPLLLDRGATVVAYDPVGMKNFQAIYPAGKYGKGSLVFAESVEEALMQAHVCFVFTEWNEIKTIRPEEFNKMMRTPLVFDGRNIFDPGEMRQAGVEYYSIGRKTER